ncbi:MAG: type IV secretion system protein [Steroidobacteraceae bacterium]
MSTRCTALRFSWLLALLALLAGAPAAHAQWAVVDVGAIAQLIQQVQLLEQELTTAQNELASSEQTFHSMTGDRGMQGLLGGVVRNYLPTSAGDLQSLLAGGSGTWSALAGTMQALIGQNAVLTSQQIAQLAPAAAYLQAVRQTTALAQAIDGQALTNSSGRFASLEQLVGAIGGATDQKAILDLGARIAAEQTLVVNEQTKLAVLQRAVQSQRWSDGLREREEIVALHGRFDSRFEPAP